MANIKGLLDKYSKVENERFFQEVVIGKEYEAAINKKADIVIDVGACAGEFGAYIYEKAGIIYAIEPYSEHYQELEANISEFNLSKIKPYKLALSNYNGRGTLVIGSRGAHRLVIGEGSDKTEKVQVSTLASFMKNVGIDHIDILKIDIENGEGNVFTALDFKDVADKISFIIGEHLGNIMSDALRKNGFIFIDKPGGFIAERII
mgnify:CR=1 FL=1